MNTTTTRTSRLIVGLLVGLAALVFILATDGEADAAGGVTCLGLAATHAGTDGNDTITGTEGPDVIAGLGGKDVIYGLGGNDIICGGTGGDRIEGGAGADRIFGGLGHDLLKGGPGADIIKAGIGNDWVYGNQSTDSVHGMSGSDVCIAETEKGCEMDYRGIRDVEEWRGLVDEYFGARGQTDNALYVMDCESQGNPFAYNSRSGAAGLFQFIPNTWTNASVGAGWPKATPFHPEANIAAAYWLYDYYDSWSRSWSCAP